VQVLVHLAVLEREDGGLLERGVRGGEVREQRGEAHADLEGVGHGGGGAGGREGVWMLVQARKAEVRVEPHKE